MQMADSGEVELTVGMTCSNEEEAYNMYNTYALNKGFGVRRSTKRCNQKGELTKRIFLCSRAGFQEFADANETGKFERIDFRCGCLAKIQFKVQGNVWTIEKIDSEHNHDMVIPEHRRFIRSGRKISKSSGDILSSMTSVGIRTTTAYSYLTNEAAGGSQNIQFTSRDAHNRVPAERRELTLGGDAQKVLDHFSLMQVNDQMFYHASKSDEEGRLTNLFWRDGLAKVDYECFGDVIVFDTTYRTNNNNMICAQIVGVNHHCKNVYFGFAFLLDETVDSFVWLYQNFLISMGNKAPKTIFTDQDPAMANAIQRVFPNTTCHRLCVWHISKNARTNIDALLGSTNFKKYFSKLLHDCENKEDFDTCWKHLMNEPCVKKDSESYTWLTRLYDIRNKWAQSYSRGILSIDIQLTQRSESTNNLFQQMACKSMRLMEFVKHFEEIASRMRETEIQDDYNSSREIPPIHVPGNLILKHGSSIYTHTIFKKFQHEFLLSLSECIIETTVEGSKTVHTLKSNSDHRVHIVTYDIGTDFVFCECRLFETKGWLCSHIWRVLTGKPGFDKIPTIYILDRWTKKVKKGRGREITCGMEANGLTSSKPARLNHLTRKSFVVNSIGATSVKRTEIANLYLDLALVALKGYNSSDSSDGEDANANISCSNSNPNMLDPPVVKSKGVHYDRMRGALEKKSKKSKTKNKVPSSSIEKTKNGKTIVSPTLPNGTSGPSFVANIDEVITLDLPQANGMFHQSSQQTSCISGSTSMLNKTFIGFNSPNIIFNPTMNQTSNQNFNGQSSVSNFQQGIATSLQTELHIPE